MLKLLIRLSAISLGLSCVVCTTSAQTQLASLNERLNQVLNSLYASPLISTKTAAAEVEEVSNTSVPETSYIVTSGPPQVVFVSPSPYLESGAQPNDFGYATETHPVTRAAWPYPYASPSALPQFSPQKFSSYPLARPYPELQRFAYPQLPSPLGPSLPPAFPPSAQYPTPYPSPLPYPLNLPSYPPALPPVASPSPFSQAYPSVTQSPFSFSPASQFLYSSSGPSPAPYPSLPSPSFPSQLSFPSFGPPALSSPALPSPSYPSPLSSLPSNYPSIPSPYPSCNVPGGYPLPAFASPSYFSQPAFPKYGELLHHPSNVGAH